jgi:hypothetical protein
LLRRLDFELLRLLNWGYTVGLCRGGPLQPNELELASNQEIILKNLDQQQTIVEGYLEKCGVFVDALRARDNSTLSIAGNRHIPATSQSLLRALLSSVLVRSPRPNPVLSSSPTFSNLALIESLIGLEELNDQLRALLDTSTFHTLLERDEESNLELLQLSETLKDTLNLICAVRPGDHSNIEFTDVGAIKLLVDVSGSRTDNNHQGLGTRDAVAQFARFKALNIMVESYKGNLWEAVKQAAAGGHLGEPPSQETNADIELQSKDITLFDDEISMDYMEESDRVSAVCRVGRNKKQKRLVWIEWKTFEDIDDFENPQNPIVLRVKKIALLLNDSEKPKEFCVPHCLGYFHYGNPEEQEPMLGFVFEVPRNVPVGLSFKPTSLFEIIQSGLDVSVSARLKLAFRISSCVLYFHSVNWLHKGLRSQSILFFPDSTGIPNLSDPIVSGFDYSRPAASDDMTERPTDNPSADIYRHPVVQSSGNRESVSPRNGFRKTYDIYSLGVVLAEIAFWKPIDHIMGIDLQTARPKHTWPVLGRLKKERGVREGICDTLGPDYCEVFMSCIEGAEAFGLEEDCDEQSPIIAAALQAGFYRKVVRRLKYLAEGRPTPLRA